MSLLSSPPSRFSTPRNQNTTPTKTRTVDVGQPLGVYDTNSVRDRVRQWQAEGGGVVAADDIGVEENQQLEQPATKSRTPKKEITPRTPTRTENVTPSKSTRRPARADTETRGSKRSGSAPAKRVVSDGHWRKKKSPPKSTAAPEVTKDTPPTSSPLHEGIREKEPPALKTEQRPKGEERIRTSVKRESTGRDHGIRVDVTPPRLRRHSRQNQRRQSELLHGEDGTGCDIEAAKVSPASEKAEREKRRTPEASMQNGPFGAKGDPGRRGSNGEKAESTDEATRSAGGTISDVRDSVRRQKGNILSQVFGDSRKIFVKQSPEPIATPRIPSIEAWLDETPDPFLDADEPPLEVIPPLNPSTKKRRVTLQEEVKQDPNRIRGALDTKEGTRRAAHGSRKRNRIPSSAIYEENPFPADFDSESALSGSGKGTTSASKFVDLVEGAKKTPPSSLKRRSARKSVSSPVYDQRKSFPLKEPSKEDDAQSALSSAHTVSSVEGPDPNNPLKPPGINFRRPFPSTGKHRLSTIASVETLDTKQGAALPSVSEFSGCTDHRPSIKEEQDINEEWGHFDPNALKRKNSRLTKHADLISVLSLPKAGSRSIQSARSIRTNRSRLATATVGDLMQELATDEIKYMRELRTLVDGVIPVLLTCVLSKSDSAVAAGLFSASAYAHEDPNFTRPIIDMGIALERLKTLHRRIPQGDFPALLTWAHGAQRVYVEYLKAWRMGFQDVVVNLAPASEDTSVVSGSRIPNCEGLDGGLPRNEEGDVVNGDGERVDVAFLLKRPLVRLKYLAKTLKGVNFIKPSAEAELLATRYQKLVDDARQRSNEERARLEDEAASNIDTTRVRDPRTLALLLGVTINRTYRVRARDHFNLALQHSSGQRVDCRVELIIRDEASDGDASGDLLICEVDRTGRWLLFPPVQFSRVSARNGDLKGEIIVMIRGVSGNGSEWQELFLLRSEDEQAGFEWVQMLGLTPVPPKIIRSQSFLSRHQRMESKSNATGLEPTMTSSGPSKSRTPSPREVDIPIGEQGENASKAWTDPLPSAVSDSPVTPSSRETAKLQKQSHNVSPSTLSRSSSNYVEQVNDLRSLPSQSRECDTAASGPTRTPRSFKEALGLSGTSTSVGLKRARAKRLSRHGKISLHCPKSPDPTRCDIELQTPSSKASPAPKPIAHAQEKYNNVRSLSPKLSQESASLGREAITDPLKENARPSYHRSRSSVPSMELPHIPKARKSSPPTTPILEPEEQPQWPTPASQDSLSPSKIVERCPVSSKVDAPLASSPSPVSSRISPKLDEAKTPVLSKNQSKPRRSSSPLKHEYEPSTASESSTESNTSTVEHNEATSVSDSSEDEDLEEGDAPTPLMPLGPLKSLSRPKISPSTSLHSTPDGTIKPSESASQAPYKTVPPQPSKASKTIASIFSWSDAGSWQSLHPDECSIVITPGLIEAYEMSAAHSKDVPLSSSTPIVDMDAFSDLASNLTSQNNEVRGDRPLVGLELTPLVPLRRGTALDISIRSPPTPHSQITSGNNIMFRSRNPEECEALYALINHSRINNPTFIALQNARGPYASSNHLANRRASTSIGGSRSSWFGGWGRSSSYRASSAPTPSIAPSDSSIGSMSSAFSALKRFGRGNGMFNISRSTITSREGSIYTSSDNSSGSGTSSPMPPGMTTAAKDASIGLSNAKIRLYIRETASKWRDMGSARLTITRPDRGNVVGPESRPMSSAHQVLDEKRIIVHGKTKGEVLLDVQLGESCFERVARTGIALSVWEDAVGPNGEIGVVGAVGGVGGGRATVYMIQMKSEAETAYTFSIVGKLRY